MVRRKKAEVIPGVVLSLFPGMDLFGMAFEMEGFCVVKGPDLLMGGDVRSFHAPPHLFHVVIGGPPCQKFSMWARFEPKCAATPNLIPEFERVVQEAQPLVWVMENVPDAPIPYGAASSEVVEAWDYGAAQRRVRRFSSNVPLSLILEQVPVSQRHPDPWPCITATEWKVTPGTTAYSMKGRAGRKVGRKLTPAEMCEGMGLPRDFEAPALRQDSFYTVLGNGVPIQMGRAVARAVRKALFELRHGHKERRAGT